MSAAGQADYWDLWSGIFQNTFFGDKRLVQQEQHWNTWCTLNHEEGMTALVRERGDFFRDMRKVGVPGIDNLRPASASLVHTPDGTWRVTKFPQAGVFRRAPVRQAQVWTKVR